MSWAHFQKPFQLWVVGVKLLEDQSTTFPWSEAAIKKGINIPSESGSLASVGKVSDPQSFTIELMLTEQMWLSITVADNLVTAYRKHRVDGPIAAAFNLIESALCASA